MKFTHTFSPDTPPVCRLGLATRGNTHLDPCDVHWAIERGVNYLNWCGRTDGMSQAVSEMGEKRQEIVFAWQIHFFSNFRSRATMRRARSTMRR